jgi:uncharacterized membrane protein
MKHTSRTAVVESQIRLHVSPLARQTLADAGVSYLGDEGFFIYEVNDAAGVSGGITVLGKAASFEAALRIADLIGPSVAFLDA